MIFPYWEVIPDIWQPEGNSFMNLGPGRLHWTQRKYAINMSQNHRITIPSILLLPHPVFFNPRKHTELSYPLVSFVRRNVSLFSFWEQWKDTEELWTHQWFNIYPCCKLNLSSNLCFQSEILVQVYGGLTLAGWKVSTQLPSHSPFSAQQELQVKKKNLWIKIRTGRLLAKYCHCQNRLDLGKVN